MVPKHTFKALTLSSLPLCKESPCSTATFCICVIIHFYWRFTLKNTPICFYIPEISAAAVRQLSILTGCFPFLGLQQFPPAVGRYVFSLLSCIVYCAMQRSDVDINRDLSPGSHRRQRKVISFAPGISQRSDCFQHCTVIFTLHSVFICQLLPYFVKI